MQKKDQSQSRGKTALVFGDHLQPLVYRDQIPLYPYYGEAAAGARGRYLALFTLLPVHFWVRLRDEVSFARLRYKTRNLPRQYASAKNLLVNIGAGSQGKPGWVNVDAFPGDGVNCIYDSRRRLPFPDASVRGIYSEHFVEHLDYTEEIPLFLAECVRVLEPGGIMRIVVPDVEKFLRAYCADGWDDLRVLRPMSPEFVDTFFASRYRTKMELINSVFYQGHEHKFGYDYETLSFVLRQFGFSRVERQTFGKSLLPELEIDQAIRECESLYVDAIK